MTVKGIVIAITVLLLARVAMSQDCPVKSDRTAIQFLLDHRANGMGADPHCVDNAFLRLTHATQFENKNYIPFLVRMLDFERLVTEDEHENKSAHQYPAIDYVLFLSRIKNAIPALVKAIKDSDSEVLRTNAAETLLEINHCMGLSVLDREANRVETSGEQSGRLEAAARYIEDHSSFMEPCKGR
jgi:hypothetical protein